MCQSVSVLRDHFWWRKGLGRWKDRAVLSFQFQVFSGFRALPWNWPPVTHTCVWEGFRCFIHPRRGAGSETWGIQHPCHAVCLGTNPGRGCSQRALFPRSVTGLFSSGRQEPLGMAAWSWCTAHLHLEWQPGCWCSQTEQRLLWCMLLAARAP